MIKASASDELPAGAPSPAGGKSTKEHHDGARRWWIALALAAITLALFWPLSHYDFLDFDDQAYVTENPYVRSGLNWNSLAWAFTTSTAGNWHPLTWISHVLDVQFSGLQAGRHHFTNVLLHTANVVLLFLLLQKMTGAVWRSALVGALFAWHPAHVESVAWIAERKDVLSALFFLLTLFAYVWHAAKPGWGRQSVTLALFALALMAKPMVVTLPFVLLLLDFWPMRRVSGFLAPLAERQPANAPFFPRLPLSRVVAEKIPLLVLSAMGCVLTLWAQQRSNAVASVQTISLWHRVTHALVSYLDYLGLLILPRHLAIFYPYPLHEETAKVMGGAALLAAASVLIIISAGRRPWLAVGWFWFLGMLAPVIGLVQAGNQAIADRYTYLPAIGLFISVVWAGAELALRIPAAKLLGPAVGVAMLAATSSQIPFWKNTRSVFEHAARVTQNNYLALTLLGSLRAADGNWDGAVELYQEALRDKPNYAEAHFFLARALEQQARTDEAVREYNIALRLNPSFEKARIFLGLLLAGEKKYDEAAAEYEAVLKTNPRSAVAHNDLARLLQSEGRQEESLRHYLAALQLDSSLAEAHNNLGILYLQKGQLADGTTQLREALRLHPGNGETEYNLALALNQQGQWEEALGLWPRLAAARPQDAAAQFQYGCALAHQGNPRGALSQFAKALLLTPDYPEALDALAWILSTDPQPEMRNGNEAVAMAEKACQLAGRQRPAFFLTLAAAYAEASRFTEAVASARQGRELAAAQGQKEIETKASFLLAELEAGHPFRGPLVAP
jgi:tetratricopeptide (TPR) repeat protein